MDLCCVEVVNEGMYNDNEIGWKWDYMNTWKVLYSWENN